ncbi:hypothetical protein [Desulfosporosinus sp. BICA1-9]|uniref:hypothetical protein n=1 Tax=Desulfosporosinus sp. BICA1-9 TaxID=1531958 RepID=UPI00054B3BDE|nr:hypothetical protein [Desulfosporosinus sp. BICA1-9]KJS45996.1 MAG: hypothetical protein VR66_27885 [Peptococcaceae bacterium BRH_c23]KJS86650.1 MAG: hypothetical protein JL57_15805 [Desulfosporosinus sp. BICA1-9]
MLKIDRLKITIRTAEQDFGFDHTFMQGINFIASDDNTCGKSSVIEGIYYALGFEEIIGGRGEKVLTSAYKNSIEYNSKTFNTLESEVYLEVYNGTDIITLYRTAKMENRDSRLVTVFYGCLADLETGSVDYDDMYVHMPNSAIREKGFHTFLERYLGLELPYVNNYSDSESKLYLQLLFSSMFIEQKRGWADIFSGMPNLGIKEAKQRTVEYILNLDTIENEKTKIRLTDEKNEIEKSWNNIVQALIADSRSAQCIISGFPSSPRILEEAVRGKVSIEYINRQEINSYISNLRDELSRLSSLKPKIVDNFDELQVELDETEKQIDLISNKVNEARRKLSMEDASIKSLRESLDTIKIDIANNKDAARLKNLGADIGSEIIKGICPVCNQAISDTLLPLANEFHIMSIDENIKHLVAQKEMFEFALNGHSKAKEELKNSISYFEASLFTLRRLALSLRSDLYAVDEELSESIVYKKLKLANEIQELEKFKNTVDNSLEKLTELSKRWKKYLDQKEQLPKEKFTLEDKKKLSSFESNFKNDLRTYGYKSVSNIDDISISRDTYLPVINNFDMKFDSSASDNIRAIWAFTMALLQTSNTHLGNHPGILIFDEPDQHSIVISNMKAFFKGIIDVEGWKQVIIGITIKDTDTRIAIESLDAKSYNMIKINEKAFTPIIKVPPLNDADDQS